MSVEGIHISRSGRSVFCGRAFLFGVLSLCALCLFSCNEGNSLSIMQSIASSRPKTTKVWRQAEVAYSTDVQGKERKVDFVFLIANDGLHAVAQNTNQDEAGEYLESPLIANNDNREGRKVQGLVRGIFIPVNYSSDDPAIMIQTVENSNEDDSRHYYKLSLKNAGDVFDPDSVEATEMRFDNDSGNAPDGWRFVCASLVNSSPLVMCRSEGKVSEDEGYRYCIGRWEMSSADMIEDGAEAGPVFKLREIRTFVSLKDYYGFWEDGEDVNALVLYWTSGDEDIRRPEYDSLVFGNDGHDNGASEHERLHDLKIRNFIVYSDGTFMGITQTGVVLHSEVDRSYNYTADSSFNYNRYVAPVVFRHEDEDGAQSSEPAVTVFGRYNGNGFIIYCYNKTVQDNKAYNSTEEWSGHIQTSGFAEEFRSEDISEMYPVILKDANGKVTAYEILILSVENGITTYSFDSLKPSEMKSNGKDSIGLVDVFGD